MDLLDGLVTDCAQLLDINSAGLLLADPGGTLHVMAASSQRTRNLDLLQLQRGEGPCLDCYRGGTAVSVADLRQAGRMKVGRLLTLSHHRMCTGTLVSRPALRSLGMGRSVLADRMTRAR